MQATKALVRVIIADLRATDGETGRWFLTDGHIEACYSSKSLLNVIECYLNRFKTDRNTVILIEREC